MSRTLHLSRLSREIWDTKYRYREGRTAIDVSIEDTWRRVARALASVEKDRRDYWETCFYGALKDFRFVPGGRILAGAGTGKPVTLFNCFVMGPILDSAEGIASALWEGVLTMQQGGGVGFDFSTLRPREIFANGSGTAACGPVSRMRIWDNSCSTIAASSARRGAMMATLRCDHPDIEEFIDAKRDATALRHFNLSVQVTDAFMDAVRDDGEWLLVFPFKNQANTDSHVVQRRWTGTAHPVPCRIVRRMRARTLWHKIMRAAYDSAEPGILFVDSINRWNNLWYCEQISATNPCGEVPLPFYGACDLGSINLTKFVISPFGKDARIDFQDLRAVVRVATRMLDNVYDLSQFPIEAQAVAALRVRRIGLGLTGLADALIMMGIRYDSEESLQISEAIMRTICHEAYVTSIELAQEKGPFPAFDREKYLASQFVRNLPASICDGIHRYGIRNSHLTAIAPAGSISLLANNVSSGLEPVFAPRYRRRFRQPGGAIKSVEMIDYAYRVFHYWNRGKPDLPSGYATATEVSPGSHLAMQAVLQRHVDNSIAKTVNLSETIDFDDFSRLYQKAYELGIKGFTMFRPNSITGQVLVTQSARNNDDHCGVLDGRSCSVSIGAE